MSKISSGSCLCGDVKFEIAGLFEGFFLCHCTRCQKGSGSAHAANLFSTTAKLKWLTGENKTKTYNHLTTRHTKSFCMTCGSGLPNMQADGTLLVVPAGSLDTECPIKPTAHIFTGSRANWDKDLELVHGFETFPG